MSDLKNNTVDHYLAQLAELEAECHASIARAAKEVAEAFQTGLDAVRTLPPNTSDLLKEATVALVKDVEILGFGRDTNPCYVRFSVGSDFNLDNGRSEGPPVKRGRYRALFFLLPLPDEEKK